MIMWNKERESLQEFAAAVVDRGAMILTGPGTADKLRKALGEEDLPFHVHSSQYVREGVVYAIEWTEDDLAKFEWERRAQENERLAMAAWWEMEGVRCATFGRDPNQNPYASQEGEGG